MPIISNSRVWGGDGIPVSWCSQVPPVPSHTHLPTLEVFPRTGLVFGWLPTLADGYWPLVVHGAMCL